MSDGFPIGAIVAFPGEAVPDASYWHVCDGTPKPIAGAFNELYKHIGDSFGGEPNKGLFYLPDFRGYFLRGTSYGSHADPDAGNRTEVEPNGSTGDAVGSLQGYATAAPSVPFTALFPHLPASSNPIAATAVGIEVASWNSDSSTESINSGGDDETRPINIAVIYYIKYADNPN